MQIRKISRAVSLIVAGIGLLTLLGWVFAIERENTGWYGTALGTAVFATVIFFFALALWRMAQLLDRAVTRNRQTEEELRRSEGELSDFFNNATLPLHWAGPDGTLLRVNDAELALLGYSREEYIGHHIAEFHADAAVIHDILTRLSAGEILRDYPARLRCKDGSLRDVLIHSSVYWVDGKFIHTRCFTRDVTELKQAENARYHLAAIVASSDDAIVSKDLDGIVRSWNDGAQRMFGYLPEEIVGQHITRIIPPERQHEESMILQRLRNGERIGNYETVRVAKDGQRIEVSLTISPVRDATGAIIGASKIVRDITSRKRAEAALEEQREWLRVTLSSIGDAVVATDAAGVVTFLNPVAETITGWPSREATGRPLQEVFRIINEKTRAPAPDPVARVLREGAIVGLANHTALLARDGREISIEDSAAPIMDITGKPIGAVLVFHDVTERRRAQDALRVAYDAAETANRTKDGFLAALSHELRTPLTPVLMLSAELEQAEEVPASLRKDFAMIRKNIEVEARIIDDLLDLTRITQGKMALRLDEVDPHPLVTHTLDILRNEIDAKGISVSLELTAPDHLISADPVRLQQVFWNIFKNAVKFTPQGGRIKIRSWNEDGLLHIATADTGLGLTAEESPRIFDAFAQGEEGARFGGLGLGLSIATLLVREHGGRIRAESPGRNRGTTFYLEFPMAAKPALVCSNAAGLMTNGAVGHD